MKLFSQLNDIPAAKFQLASVLISSVIDQYIRGFGSSKDCQYAMKTYKALVEQYPNYVISVQAMLKTKKKQATPDNTVDDIISSVFGKEKAAELAAESNDVHIAEIEAVENSIQTDFDACKGSLLAWNQLPAIAQWNFLVRTENGLRRALLRYSSWYKSSPTLNNLERVELYGDAAKQFPTILDNIQADLDLSDYEGMQVLTRQAA